MTKCKWIKVLVFSMMSFVFMMATHTDVNASSRRKLSEESSQEIMRILEDRGVDAVGLLEYSVEWIDDSLFSVAYVPESGETKRANFSMSELSVEELLDPEEENNEKSSSKVPAIIMVSILILLVFFSPY